MRWRKGHRSAHVEDRRGRPATRMAGMRLPGGGAKLGVAGIIGIIVVAVLNHYGVVDLGLGGGRQSPSARPSGSKAASFPSAGGRDPKEEELVEFVHFLVDDIQGTWQRKFKQAGLNYKPAVLVIFRDAVQSACGFQTAATGPFYCPGDQKVYIDLSFYRDLATRFRAPGDFAQAYVIAHEYGHHVQNILGINAEMRRKEMRNPSQKNQLSVAVELQADCLAGIWGHDAGKRNVLEPGDLREGMNAAAAIGDDAIARDAGVAVRPERFTHGSSKERMANLERGLDTGALTGCGVR